MTLGDFIDSVPGTLRTGAFSPNATFAEKTSAEMLSWMLIIAINYVVISYYHDGEEKRVLLDEASRLLGKLFLLFIVMTFIEALWESYK